MFEEVYMHLSLGDRRKGESYQNSTKMVYELHKSIYGLKKASRQWLKADIISNEIWFSTIKI